MKCSLCKEEIGWAWIQLERNPFILEYYISGFCKELGQQLARDNPGFNLKPEYLYEDDIEVSISMHITHRNKEKKGKRVKVCCECKCYWEKRMIKMIYNSIKKREKNEMAKD